MIDDPELTFGLPDLDELLDDLGHRVGGRSDSAGARRAAKRPHEWKAGGDISAGRVREDFAYIITDENDFDSDVPLDFTFADRRHDYEQSLFVQDQIRSGPWTVNAGLRWDHYRLVVEDNAFSPRLAVA